MHSSSYACEGQDELVAILGKKLIKSLIRHISLPPIYTLGLILSSKWPRVHPDLHIHTCTYINMNVHVLRKFLVMYDTIIM